MSGIVDSLEFSVRTGNVLRKMGVTTMRQLLAVTKNDFMAQKNAGEKSWRELEEVVADLLGPSPREQHNVEFAVDVLNKYLAEHVEAHLVRSRRTGLLTLAWEKN